MNDYRPIADREAQPVDDAPASPHLDGSQLDGSQLDGSQLDRHVRAPYARDDEPHPTAAETPVMPAIDTEADHRAKNSRNRKRGLLALGGVVLLGGLLYTGYEVFLAPAAQATDDAYVAGDVVPITAREPATVLSVDADNTEQVKAGQVLVEFDPATVDAQLAAAEAQLGQAVRSVRSGFAKVDAGSAEIASAQADLAKARDDLGRRQVAAKEGAVSGEEVAHAADSVRTAQAALALARGHQNEAAASVAGTSISENPEVLAAEAAVRRSVIAQQHMRLVAPVSGVIAQRMVQVGQQVAAGTPLMAVVPLDRLWIDANFRETQLADLRVGQDATIKTDVYGDSVTYHGKVVGLGAGSGSAFSLLPPQNASGNWIKVVQRLPVRIALDPAELRRNPLQIGLSVKVEVGTANHSGIPVARAGAALPYRQTSQSGEAQADAIIARIIAQNSGGRGR